MHLTKNVDDWERIASIGVGAAMATRAARRGKFLSAETAVGLALVARGASGFCPVNAAVGRGRRKDDTRAALGGNRGVRLEDSITIRRPAGELFSLWQDPANLPRFMTHLERVERVGPSVSHWVMRGPAGVSLAWDAETVNEIPDELIAWRSLPGADVASAGSVHFRPHGDATEVTVKMQYDPPGGKPGAVLAWLAGQSPASRLREDLRRMKRLLESGEAATVNGQSAGRRANTLSFARWVDA
jgi:uncharacterized membrane protein